LEAGPLPETGQWGLPLEIGRVEDLGDHAVAGGAQLVGCEGDGDGIAVVRGGDVGVLGVRLPGRDEDEFGRERVRDMPRGTGPKLNWLGTQEMRAPAPWPVRQARRTL